MFQQMRKQCPRPSVRPAIDGDGDGLLFLGKAESLTLSPMEPGIYVDADYHSEINRRRMIVSGKPLMGLTAETNTVSPHYGLGN